MPHTAAARRGSRSGALAQGVEAQRVARDVVVIEPVVDDHLCISASASAPSVPGSRAMCFRGISAVLLRRGTM